MGGPSLVAEVGAYSMAQAAYPAGAYDALSMFASHSGVYSWRGLRRRLLLWLWDPRGLRRGGGERFLQAFSVASGQRDHTKECSWFRCYGGR